MRFCTRRIWVEATLSGCLRPTLVPDNSSQGVNQVSKSFFVLDYTVRLQLRVSTMRWFSVLNRAVLSGQLGEFALGYISKRSMRANRFRCSHEDFKLLPVVCWELIIVFRNAMPGYLLSLVLQIG